MEKFGTDTKAKALTLETLAAELAALQGRANSLIVFDASVLVSAAMDADGTSYQAPRKARVTDVLAMSQTVFDELSDVLHHPRPRPRCANASLCSPRSSTRCCQAAFDWRDSEGRADQGTSK